MGGWLSYYWWGGDPDVVNPVSGMTRREIYAVQKTWAPAYENCVATGSEFFKRLFRACPETKDFFRMLRRLSEDEFDANHQFRAHVINLMASFNQAVVNLHQPEVVVVMMNKLGVSHAKRKIKESHFNELKVVIVNIFIEVFNLDKKTLGAWSKAIDFLYKHIFETLNSPIEED
ncbi:cytoglobin-1-like [Leptidea sinapis]|uniref:cytoglobin-1-like n=1 Tax=Leptidea sinapis TaxID=189913 RepID=UPI00212133F2|nr:cytoglobin-1-like [Leptidea sinapis]XP_050670843.1 cytoglobin-1-like [Leptidea sinapis]XP_050670844.1 cytoglobin-1-like [Leptidea sinapis]